jgi:hypothetical protein
MDLEPRLYRQIGSRHACAFHEGWLLGFPAQLSGGEDYCFYTGSFFLLFFFFFFFFFLLSPLARKR